LFFFAPSMFLNKIVLPNDFNQNWLIYLSAIPLNLLGGYLISIFPLIKLSPQGIVLKGFYLSQTIKWNEVIGLVESKSGTVLILVNRKRFHLLNGLLFQQITGLLLNYKQPVILIYSGLQKNKQLLEDIKKNLIS